MARHLYDRLSVIATPKEGMANCASKADYARRHANEMKAKRAAFQSLDIKEPFASDQQPVPFVAGGKWVVMCDCGDAPMASPAWDEARCFNCGAIYSALPWPEQIDLIAAALVARPSALVRAWLPGETVDDLIAQNIEHGIGGLS